MSTSGFSEGEAFSGEMKESSRERFERRQRHVAVMIRLDQMMNASYGTVTEEQLLACIEPLPDVLKQAATEVITRHLERRQKTLETEADIRRLAKEGGYPTGPEGLGEFLFFHRTKEEPLGEVRLERAGESFVMTLANPDDYRLFYVPDLDLFPEQQYVDARLHVDDTSGSYHTNLLPTKGATQTYGRLTMKGELNFVLLVKASLQDPEHRKIVDHEHQHHVNHAMLDLFQRSERYPKKPDAIEPAITRPVKDELLAYLRERATGVFLEKNILSPLYQRLFTTNPPEAGEKMQEVVRSVARLLDASTDVWDKFQARDALVFHLIDIPLEDIPAHIEQLTEFFRPLVQAVDSFSYTSALLNSWEIFKTVPERQEAYEKMHRKTFDMADSTNDAIQSVFTKPADAREAARSALDAQRASFQEAWREFHEGEAGLVFGYVQPKEHVRGGQILERVLLDLSALPREVLQRFSVDVTDEEASRSVVGEIEGSFSRAGVVCGPVRRKVNRGDDRELTVQVLGSGEMSPFVLTLLLEPKTKTYER